MFYHVSLGQYKVGHIINPGNHALAYREFKPGGPYPAEPRFTELLWELALESARVASHPTAPSRLNCVFACETVDHARRFRDGYRQGGRIYGVKLVSQASSLHRGDFTAISTPQASSPYTDFMSQAAARYWAAVPSQIIEIIIGGAVRVVTGEMK